MKKIKLLTVLFLAAVCALSLLAFSSCTGKEGSRGIKVIYNLNEGTYKNSEENVVVYYKYPDGAKRLIKAIPIGGDGTAKVERLGYNFAGWYKDADFTEPWDFENDTVGDEGVTLYANWVKKTQYIYSIGYMKDGQFEEVNTTVARPLLSFDFSLDAVIEAADMREGYTLLYKSIKVDENDYAAYFDEKGNLKESDTDVTIRVYAEYIKGDYLLLYSYDDFSNLSDSANKLKGKTLLLMNDIDCGGKTLGDSFRSAFAADKNGTFNYLGIHSYDPEGKGTKYSVSNFAISRSYMDKKIAPLTASVFSDIGTAGDTNAANPIKISNVDFTDVTINADVGNDSVSRLYVSSFAENIYNAEITNVNVTVKVIASRLRGSDEEPFFFEAEHVYARETENVKIDGCDFAITETVNKKGEKFVLTKESA